MLLLLSLRAVVGTWVFPQLMQQRATCLPFYLSGDFQTELPASQAEAASDIERDLQDAVIFTGPEADASPVGWRQFS